MNRQLFLDACQYAAADTGRTTIGTYSETAVHRALKYYYVPHEDCHEVEIGGYIADAVGEDGIFEIQTSSFSKLIPKLTALLAHTRVTLVYPIIVTKHIVRIDGKTGEQLSRRLSPKKSDIYDLFKELYWIRELLPDKRLSIYVVMLTADEYRDVSKRSRSYRIKPKTIDRVPVEMIDEIRLTAPEDYRRFIPQELEGREFTSAIFASCARIKAPSARQALKVLCELGLCEKIGKSGKSCLYRITSMGANLT